MHAGERFAADFALGDVPATRLGEVMERELAVLVLMVDAQPGISGAACRLPELDAVLIARHEVVGRRNFDLAHELFHVLTWDAMPPAHYEEAIDAGGNRVEQLANSFASAVLMPAGLLERYGSWSTLSGDELIRRLNRVADQLQVTASALKWRLAALGTLSRATARSVTDAALRNDRHAAPPNTSPARFSRPFMEVMGLALDRGHVSFRRVAALLDVNTEELAPLFASHGIDQRTDL